MEILKTKQERHESAIETSTKTIAEVCEKVETYKKLTITFDRSDFKDELSIPFGFAFQDMKKENRILITELVKKYDVKFEPSYDCDGLKVLVHIKKK